MPHSGFSRAEFFWRKPICTWRAIRRIRRCGSRGGCWRRLRAFPALRQLERLMSRRLGRAGAVRLYIGRTRRIFATRSAEVAKFYSISAGYLRAAGTRLLVGRESTWHDGGDVPKIALVNELRPCDVWGQLGCGTPFQARRWISVPDSWRGGRRKV